MDEGDGLVLDVKPGWNLCASGQSAESFLSLTRTGNAYAISFTTAWHSWRHPATPRKLRSDNDCADGDDLACRRDFVGSGPNFSWAYVRQDTLGNAHLRSLSPPAPLGLRLTRRIRNPSKRRRRMSQSMSMNCPVFHLCHVYQRTAARSTFSLPRNAT